MSKTPLIDCLKSLNHDRYHMPGHKGKMPKNFPNAFEIDFTEIDKTGNLFLADGPIYKSEQMYKDYFGCDNIMYLTGGSTQGIMTAIFSAKPKGILVDRNSHKALCNALGLIDINPVFIEPKLNTNFLIPDKIDLAELEEKLIKNEEIDTFFVTSPNYYGVCQDINGISKICKKNGVKLIVDEAHGCHFRAINVKNAIENGADISITSAHKTTDSLGQGAVIMWNDSLFNIRHDASIFGTSSPSYLIMSSIEIALSNIGLYEKIIPKCIKIRENIEQNTKFSVLENDDVCRLVINTAKTELSGQNLHKILEEKYNIVCEMSDTNNVVFIITYNDENLDFLYNAIKEISEITNFSDKKPINQYKKFENVRKMTIRETLFSKAIAVLPKNAENKIAKSIIAPYPPGVPVVYPGEIILKEHIEYFDKICYSDYIYIVD